jgi:hypothetical protein
VTLTLIKEMAAIWRSYSLTSNPLPIKMSA